MSTTRLPAAINAVCPILGVSVGTPGDSGTVRIDYDPSATAPQRQAAASALAAFDGSESAQAAWELAVSRQAALTSLLSRQDETAIGVPLGPALAVGILPLPLGLL